MAIKLKTDSDFTPCPVSDEDEIFPNGIFRFNITKIHEFIHENPDHVTLTTVAVKDYAREYSSLDDSHIDSVDISQPVVLAEISPGRYNLIDGHHRMEKARRMGVNILPSYRLSVDQHLRFLTEHKSYLAYLEYWNDKLDELGRDSEML
ncbi:MAG: ParB N-terminal domain-containing protein [FCB group bacterium]|nr:ParB N-terminal domain-containing protein [FCB group bacterium]